MSLKVGIGALIDGDVYNDIRLLELRIAGATGNWAGLGQPPHITIKRPFELGGVDDLQKVAEIFDEVLAGMQSFPVFYTGIGDFDKKILFLRVDKNEQLDHLYQLLRSVFPAASQQENVKEMIFHTTLALSLDSEQFTRARKAANNLAPALLEEVSISKIGLFFSTDGSHWTTVREVKLA